MQVAHDGAGRAAEPKNRERGEERQKKLDGDKRDGTRREASEIVPDSAVFHSLHLNACLMVGVPLIERVSCTQKESLYNGSGPPAVI